MKKDKDDIAMTLACLIGQHEARSYADSVYRSAEVYEELTGKKILLSRPEDRIKKKWYQFWK